MSLFARSGLLLGPGAVSFGLEVTLALQPQPAVKPKPVPWPISQVAPQLGGQPGYGGGAGNYWYCPVGPIFSPQRRPWSDDSCPTEESFLQRPLQQKRPDGWEKELSLSLGGEITPQPNQNVEPWPLPFARLPFEEPQRKKDQEPLPWTDLATKVLIEGVKKKLATEAARKEAEREVAFARREQERQQELAAFKGGLENAEERRRLEWNQLIEEQHWRERKAQWTRWFEASQHSQQFEAQQQQWAAAQTALNERTENLDGELESVQRERRFIIYGALVAVSVAALAWAVWALLRATRYD